MYEFTVVHAFALNNYTYKVGEKITDPEVMELLSLPRYSRSVRRHYATTPKTEPEAVSEPEAEEPVKDEEPLKALMPTLPRAD